LEHWEAFRSAQAAGKKKVKTVMAAIVHPKKDKEKIQAPAENVHVSNEQVSTEPIMKSGAEKPADKALRARAEQIRRKSQHDDERWRSGSQWRWEIITGRVQNQTQEDEAKRKRAMAPKEEDGKQQSSEPAKSLIQDGDTTANNSSGKNAASHQPDNTHNDKVEPSEEKVPNV
jgi:hypothetical protein